MLKLSTITEIISSCTIAIMSSSFHNYKINNIIEIFYYSLFYAYYLKPRVCMRRVKKNNSLLSTGMATILRYMATIAAQKHNCNGATKAVRHRERNERNFLNNTNFASFLPDKAVRTGSLAGVRIYISIC